MGEMVLRRAGARVDAILLQLMQALQVQVHEFQARARESGATAELTKLVKTFQDLLTVHGKVAQAEAEDGGAAHDVEGLRARVMEKLKALRGERAPTA